MDELSGLMTWMFHILGQVIRFFSIIFLIIVGLTVFLLPSIIAFYRKHHYKHVILGVNLVMGLTGAGYLIAFVWAVWPRKTAIFDVAINDPTTNSVESGQEIYGRIGSNVRSFVNACKNSTDEKETITILHDNREYEEDFDGALRRLVKLRDDGVITEDDYEKKKKQVLGL